MPKKFSFTSKTPLSQIRSSQPLTHLFTESQALQSHSLLELILLNSVGIIIYVMLGFISIGIFVLLSINTSLLSSFQNIQFQYNSFDAYLLLGLIFVFFLIGFIVLGSLIQLGSLLIVDKGHSVSLRVSIKRALPLVLPLFISGLIVSAVSFNGLLPLMLPGIVFYILLYFLPYEVQRSASLRSTVFILSRDNKKIIRRLIFLIAGYLVAVLVVTKLLVEIEGTPTLSVAYVSFLANALMGWYALANSIGIYRQARMQLTKKRSVNIRWIFFITILGWFLLLLTLLIGKDILTTDILHNALQT